jgi:PAS domain S-box-containing protein
MSADAAPCSLLALLHELTAAVHRDEPNVQVLRRVIDMVSVATLVANTHGQYVAANDAAATLTGYTTSELLQLSVWQLTPNANQHEADVLWRTFLSLGEQHGEYHLLTKDTRVIVAEYAARTDVMPGLHLSLMRLRRSAR